LKEQKKKKRVWQRKLSNLGDLCKNFSLLGNNKMFIATANKIKVNRNLSDEWYEDASLSWDLREFLILSGEMKILQSKGLEGRKDSFC
jgi:hypothetical protein